MDRLSGLVIPHPIRCFTEGPTLGGRQEGVENRLFILCAANYPSPFWPFHDRNLNDPSRRAEALDRLHDTMLDAPKDVARLIDERTCERFTSVYPRGIDAKIKPDIPISKIGSDEPCLSCSLRSTSK